MPNLGLSWSCDFYFRLISSSKMAAFRFVVCLLAFSEATVFLDEPHNQTVEVGGQATFRCNFKQDYDCVKIYWVFSNSHCSEGSFSTFAYCRSLLPNPLLIDGSRLVLTFGHSTYQVQINDVRPSDAGYYACWDSLGEEYSRCGHLKVVDPPTPLCMMLSSSVRVGESVSLRCQVPENALAPTKLAWHPQTSDSICGLEVSPGESCIIQRVLRDSDFSRNFTCIAGYDVYSGPNCTVYPFDACVVTVRFVGQSMSEGSAVVRMECVAQVGTSTRYLWSVKDSCTANKEWREIRGNPDKFTVIESRFLLIKNTGDCVTLQVRCTAYSSLQASKTSEAVSIVFVAGTSEPGCGAPMLTSAIWVCFGVQMILAVGSPAMLYGLKRRSAAQIKAGKNSDQDSTSSAAATGGGYEVPSRRIKLKEEVVDVDAGKVDRPYATRINCD